MKNSVLFVLIMALLSITATAQLKPVSGDLGLGFKLTGLDNVAFNNWNNSSFQTPQALVRFYLNDKFALRATLGVDVDNSTVENNRQGLDNSGLATTFEVKEVTSVSSTSLGVGAGVEYHLTSQATKIDPYVGAEIPFAFVGTSNQKVDYDSTRTRLVDAATSYLLRQSTETNTPGGIAVGLNLLAGFNYFFSDNFAIGAEYGLGTNYQLLGGTTSTKTTGVLQPTDDPNNSIVIDSSSSFDSNSTKLNISTGATGGINISVFW